MKPSFRALLDDAKATRREDHPVWRYNPKTDGRLLAEVLGIRVPALLAGPCSVGRMEPPSAGPMVLKPNGGSTGRGVFPLVADGGQYTDLWTGLTGRWGRVRQWAYAAKQTRPGMSHDDVARPPWLLEEMILRAPGELSDDWKVYVIGGRAQIIRQRRPGGRQGITTSTHKHWTPDWRPAGAVEPWRRLDPTLAAPRHGAEIIEVAEAIADQVAGPFVRVDVLEDAEGAVFGEICPHPGGRRSFTPEWDQRLGEAWLAAR